MPARLIALPRLLAPDVARAERLLRDIYCDKMVRVIAANPLHLLVRVEDDLSASTLRDPAAPRALRQWFSGAAAGWALRGTARDAVPAVLSLQHDRVMPELARRCAQLGWERLAMLHVDSHADLQSPTANRIAPRRWAAPVGKTEMDLEDSESVARFVAEGFIGIGGFLLPLLDAHHRANFVHWAPLHDAGHSWRASVVALPFARCSGPQERHYLTEDANGPISCTTTARGPDAVAALTDDDPLFLDIDMDAWCNVYDDSLARTEHSFDADTILRHMATDLAFLKKALSGRRIAMISCALSPQFFPVPLWRPAVELLSDCWQIRWEGSLPWNTPAATDGASATR